MPYKDKEAQREANRVRMQRVRGNTKVTQKIKNVLPDSVLPKLLHRSNGEDYNPDEKLYNNPHYPDGTQRYLGPLSDGQALDRLTV